MAGIVDPLLAATQEELFDLIEEDITGARVSFEVVRIEQLDGEYWPQPKTESIPVRRKARLDSWASYVRPALDKGLVQDIRATVMVASQLRNAAA